MDKVTMQKVTIGIPTYNQKEFLIYAIESALAQNYPALEVIVADDCSTDGTEKVIKKYFNDSRFKYHRNRENLGRIKNYRNLLYNLATGDWYLNLDGDDVLLEASYITQCMKIIETIKDLVFVYGIRREINANFIPSIISSNSETVLSYVVFEGKEYFFKIPRMRKDRLNHITCLYNRKLAMEIDFYRKNIISTDLESLYRLSILGKVAFLPISAGGWRRHTTNVSAVLDINKLKENYSLFTNVVDYAFQRMPEENTRIRKWLEDAVAKKLYTNTLSLFSAGKITDIFSLFRHCKGISPKSVLKVIFNPKLYVKLFITFLKGIKIDF